VPLACAAACLEPPKFGRIGYGGSASELSWLRTSCWFIRGAPMVANGMVRDRAPVRKRGGLVGTPAASGRRRRATVMTRTHHVHDAERPKKQGRVTSADSMALEHARCRGTSPARNVDRPAEGVTDHLTLIRGASVEPDMRRGTVSGLGTCVTHRYQ
jgi:hypothetical protein